MRISYLKLSALLLVIAAASGPALAGASPERTTAKSSPQTTVLPADLQPALYRTLAKDAGAAYQVEANGCVVPPNQALKACFNAHGAHFTGATVSLALHLVAYGHSTHLVPVYAVAPKITDNRVTYAHGALSEWWRILPIGFEQGFTLSKRPAGQGDLLLALIASSTASQQQNALAWGKLRYGKLVVTDANGKVVPATLKSKGDRILITVNDAQATYPLVVDPLVWIEQKVTASNGGIFEDFGWTVTISNATALIGAYGTEANQGAVYVFTKSNGAWSEAQKLTASDGTYSDHFGWSLALNGTTALIGAPFNDSGQGAAYVFTQSNGTWSEVQELTADDGTAGDNFGDSVALDGTTALISAPLAAVGSNAAQGTVYVFTDSGGTWTQTQKLAASDGTVGDQFGHEIAPNGTNVLIGAPFAGDQYQGAVYEFTHSEDIWAQTQKLTANDGTMGAHFGYSIALSNTTALIGTPSAAAKFTDQGAAYVFTASNGTWTQAQKLTASDGANSSNFGYSVALSNTTALISASWAAANGNAQQGAAYVFSEENGSWEQKQKLIASDGAGSDNFGYSVALSGSTAIVGSPYANVNGVHHQGAAYFYTQGDLALAVSAPQTVGPSDTYISQAIATNNASAASPAVAVTVAVPAAASFVSANATQGDCSEAAGIVTCDFGQIVGNAGTATADMTLKAPDSGTILNTASIAMATPELTASATTEIVANTPPVAKDGTLSTVKNTPASSTLKATDSDGDSLVFSIVAAPQHGKVTLDDTATGAYTYTPDKDYSSTDSFTFKANDGEADSNVATVSITVINSVPVAKDGTLSTNTNTSASGIMQASDPDGDALTFEIIGSPGHGQVKIDNATTGAYTYTPAEDYSGSDAFSFKVSDGTVDSNTAAVSITVKAVNTPPVASNGSLTTDENKAASGTLKASDPDGDSLTFSIVISPEHGTVTIDDATSGAYTYTPNGDYSGADSFGFKASDGQADSNTATVSITVKAVSPPPNDSGGGGGFGWLALLALIGLAFTGAFVRRRRA